MAVDYWKIITKHITNPLTLGIYTIHVTLVTARALRIARNIGYSVEDLRFIEEAAMLHDIGIINVNAPSIGCSGDLPYIAHIEEGAKILEAEGLPKHARICEHHTGVGIDKDQVIARKLPLSAKDYIAENQIERIIAWADLFFSKDADNLFEERTLEEIREVSASYGPTYGERFAEWEAELAKFDY